MSDEFDWAKDDAYMLEEFNKQQRQNPWLDPEFVAHQERKFQEELAAFRVDHPGATENDYVDYLLDGVEQ